MIVTDPVTWVLDRLDRLDRGCFAVRFNDGEHAQMFRTCADGQRSSDDSHMRHAIGDELAAVLRELSFADPDRVLIGCDWWYDKVDVLNERFRRLLYGHGMYWGDHVNGDPGPSNFARGHWPLEAVADGSVYRLLDALRERGKTVLVTHSIAEAARMCAGGLLVRVSSGDSVRDRGYVEGCTTAAAENGYTFLWAAGYGLKGTAFDIWRRFPQSSHLDVGHLFDPAFGRVDRAWATDPSHPWYRPYFDRFVPYVKGFA